ncbi:SDR family NAD(P)-dependent oxidoreductase [Neisseria dentiae]|uniref:SDR family NAD(P)-dependent oxidoreductase n=1 Tax=Neisseria dentiae TaxID=194197 RepID=UPI00211C174B|nr:SDR family oxidoreductase [Neisseria dentiae]MCQ9326432.1 SDR family oxidoreductase [Neisseria dentiae]
MTLRNKNAVITGGSDGIGLGITQAFAERGANIVLIGRSADKLAQARQVLTQYPVSLIEADLSDMAQLRKAAEQVIALLGRIDTLVNNAGLGRFVPFVDTDEALFDSHFNLNVKAPYFLTQVLLPQLVAAKGSVINISSYFAQRMLSDRASTAYSATKGALNSLTKSLAFELGAQGVRVNAIAPGSVETPQLRHNLSVMPTEKQQVFRDMVKRIYPMQHIGSPADIGQAAVFLASDDAKWITGAILNVDGGLTTN